MEASGSQSPRGAGGARERSNAGYNAAQKQTIEMCVSAGMGYRPILAKYPEMGFALDGLKSACQRLRANGALERAKGSGSKRTRRTPDTVEQVRQYMGENPGAPCGDAASAFNLPKTTMRMILTDDLDSRPLRQVTAQRAKPANAQKRLEICKLWGEQLESGELDVEKIFFTDGKLFRLGACSGGNQNFVAYVRDGVNKHEAPNDIITREGGQWQGVVSVMVGLGLCFRGKGGIRWAPKGGSV